MFLGEAIRFRALDWFFYLLVLVAHDVALRFVIRDLADRVVARFSNEHAANAITLPYVFSGSYPKALIIPRNPNNLFLLNQHSCTVLLRDHKPAEEKINS